MSKANLAYAIWCEWLYSLQQSPEALFEEAQLPEDMLTSLLLRWSSLSEDIAGWIIEAHTIAINDIAVSSVDYEVMENTIEHIQLEWDRFAARHLLELASEPDEELREIEPLQLRFYALMCHYMSQILSEVERRMPYNTELLDKAWSVKMQPRLAELAGILRRDGETLMKLTPVTHLSIQELVERWFSTVQRSVDEVTVAIES